MKHLLILSLFALACASVTRADSPHASYAKPGIPPIGNEAMAALKDTMSTAGVTEVVITRTSSNASEQARVMYEFVEKYGVDAARAMYGVEGDAVVDAYVAAKKENPDKMTVISKMKETLIQVLPAARANNRLMHVERPEFDVFDIAIATVKPAEHRAALVKAARTSGRFVRILDPTDGEKDAYHFEFKK